MVYVPARGHSLLIPSGTISDPDKKHLFVIVTDPCANGEHLLVPISSVKPHVFHDPACVLAPGTHSFIKVRSFAEYRLCRTIKANHLTKCVDGWLYVKKDDASAVFVKDLCDGITISNFTAPRIEKYFRANIAVP